MIMRNLYTVETTFQWHFQFLPGGMVWTVVEGHSVLLCLASHSMVIKIPAPL